MPSARGTTVPCLQLHLTRGVPKVRDLHAVQPDGRRADVVGQVDDELEQQTRKVRSLGPPDTFHHDERRQRRTIELACEC